MATADGLHPLQQAFLEEAALQCGICTPGFLVAAKGLLDNEPSPDEHRIRYWLAGNLLPLHGLRQDRARSAEGIRRDGVTAMQDDRPIGVQTSTRRSSG